MVAMCSPQSRRSASDLDPGSKTAHRRTWPSLLIYFLHGLSLVPVTVSATLSLACVAAPAAVWAASLTVSTADSPTAFAASQADVVTRPSSFIRACIGSASAQANL